MFAEIVKSAGAEFVEQRGGSIFFRDPLDGKVISLYENACRDEDEVRRALKSHREIVRDFPPLIPTNQIR